MGTGIHTDVDLRVLGRAHAKLKLGWSDIGQIIGVDESTLHRWRSGTSRPRPMAVARLALFEELLSLLNRVFAGPDVARKWLIEKRPAGLGGRDTPMDVMLAGRLDRVVSLLNYLARGG